MTKFQRIQKISSVIPFASSVFVFFATYIVLARKRATMKNWLQFFLIWALAFVAVFVVDTYLMTGLHPILNVIASGALLALANLFSVDLQIKCESRTEGSVVFPSIIGFAIVAVVLTAIVLATMISSFSNAMEHIPDTNGMENTNVTSYTQEQLVSAPDQRISYMSGSGFGGDRGTFHAKKVSGIETVLTTESENDSLILEIDAQLNSGNMEVVIVVDGAYYAHVPLNMPQKIVLEDVAGKTVTVRFAAESADMSLTVVREIA